MVNIAYAVAQSQLFLELSPASAAQVSDFAVTGHIIRYICSYYLW